MIGVFDSGVGGLTVARAIRDLLPHEPIVYLGDTARVPYGNRGSDTIRRYSLNAATLLLDYDIHALVVACNTATAHALDHLREHLDVPVVGVIEPVCAAAASRTDSQHVAVVATRATVTSNRYPQALERLLPDARVTQIAAPLLVPLAEEGWTDGPIAEAIAREYLQSLSDTDVDTLILGCTHYPLLRPTLALMLDILMPRHVTILDSALSTAAHLRDTLAELDLLSDSTEPAPIRFLVTDEPRGFMGTAVRFFGGRIASPEHVDIRDVATST